MGIFDFLSGLVEYAVVFVNTLLNITDLLTNWIPSILPDQVAASALSALLYFIVLAVVRTLL